MLTGASHPLPIVLIVNVAKNCVQIAATAADAGSVTSFIPGNRKSVPGTNFRSAEVGAWHVPPLIPRQLNLASDATFNVEIGV
jgi:hypothetical protein